MNSKPKPAMARAIHAIERRVQAGEPLLREAIVEEAGISRGIADSALAAWRARTPANSDDIVLSASAQKKYDAKVRAFKKSFDYAVETKARQVITETTIPHTLKQLARIEALMKQGSKVMSKAEYRTVLACLHPDASHSKEKLAEAFRIFSSYRFQLADDEPERKLISGMPRTVAELLARKRKHA